MSNDKPVMSSADAKRVERELYVLVPPYGSEGPSLLRQMTRPLLAHKWIVLLCVIVGFAVGLAAYVYQRPIYIVSATLAPVTDESSGALAGLESQVGGLAALAGISVGEGSLAKDEAIAILKSRTLTYDFLRDNNLLPVLFADRWDAEAKQWTVASEDVPTLSDAWGFFDEQIRAVREDRRTGLITLSIEWTDREAAVRWVRDLTSRLNAFMRRRAIEEAETSLRYLNRELEKAKSVEVQQAIYRLIETQVKKIMLANVREEYAMRVIDPAFVPDPDEFDHPKLLSSLMAGGLVGFLFGMLVAVWLWARKRGWAAVPDTEQGGTAGSALENQ